MGPLEEIVRRGFPVSVEARRIADTRETLAELAVPADRQAMTSAESSMPPIPALSIEAQRTEEARREKEQV